MLAGKNAKNATPSKVAFLVAIKPHCPEVALFYSSIYKSIDSISKAVSVEYSDMHEFSLTPAGLHKVVWKLNVQILFQTTL